MRQLLQFNQILCIVLVFVNFALLIAATVLTNIAIVSIDKEKYDVHRCISAVQIVNTFILAAVPLGVVFFEAKLGIGIIVSRLYLSAIFFLMILISLNAPKIELKSKTGVLVFLLPIMCGMFMIICYSCLISEELNKPRLFWCSVRDMIFILRSIIIGFCHAVLAIILTLSSDFAPISDQDIPYLLFLLHPQQYSGVSAFLIVVGLSSITDYQAMKIRSRNNDRIAHLVSDDYDSAKNLKQVYAVEVFMTGLAFIFFLWTSTMTLKKPLINIIVICTFLMMFGSLSYDYHRINKICTSLANRTRGIRLDEMENLRGDNIFSRQGSYRSYSMRNLPRLPQIEDQDSYLASDFNDRGSFRRHLQSFGSRTSNTLRSQFSPQVTEL